jgi:lipoprotein-anchoring transpeptidase ErfK/SrfK
MLYAPAAMRRFFPCAVLLSAAACFLATARASAVTVSPDLSQNLQIVINVDRQRLEIMRSGTALKTFPVSTSKFGLGDDWRSYKTPLGLMQVSSKMGDNLPMGAVIKGGRFTGEVLAPNAPGRDPIVTRVIRLEGLEEQNRHALGRGIYIHGTPEEGRIGKPVSWGCIRMRSKDLVELYQTVEVGTKVLICTKKTAPLEPHWSLFSWWS